MIKTTTAATAHVIIVTAAEDLSHNVQHFGASQHMGFGVWFRDLNCVRAMLDAMSGQWVGFSSKGLRARYYSGTWIDDENGNPRCHMTFVVGTRNATSIKVRIVSPDYYTPEDSFNPALQRYARESAATKAKVAWCNFMLARIAKMSGTGREVMEVNK
jgi:hypothetical protein